MSNTNINTLITGLGVVTLSSTVTNDDQDEVMLDLARGAFPGVMAQVGASYVAVTGGTARYTLPAASYARVPLAVCYDDRELAHVRKDEAWAINSSWKDDSEPYVVGYLQDPEDRPNFSLIPPPSLDGETVGAATPFNGTWVEGNLTLIYSTSVVAFTGTTYDDFMLPIALEVLARDFARDSDHQDEAFSQATKTLADLFFMMTKPLGSVL